MRQKVNTFTIAKNFGFVTGYKIFYRSLPFSAGALGAK
jgi:hypothetical protein